MEHGDLERLLATTRHAGTPVYALVFEFEVDAQGKVTGAFLDQETPKGLQRMRLTRK